MEQRRGELSDGEILARLDTISGSISEIRTDMADWRSEWRNEFVAKAVYEADQRTAAEVRKQLEDADNQQGAAIADLQAEATRKDRDRRKMWTAILVAIVAAIAAWLFSFIDPGNGKPIVVCVPTATQSCR